MNEESQDQVDDSIQSNVTPDATDHVVERRRFLQGALATVFAGGIAANAEAQSPKKPVVNTTGKKDTQEAPKPTIEKIEGKDQWIIRKLEAEENGDGWRGPSFGIPQAYAVEPIMLTTTVDLEALDGPIDQHLLLPLPRDYGEALRLETREMVQTTGMSDVSLDLTVVKSQPNDNQFISCHVKGTPSGGPIKVVIKGFSWMVHPKVAIEGQNVIRAGVNQQIAVAADDFVRKAQGQLKYDVSQQQWDLEKIDEVTHGDCGVYSQLVKKMSGGNLETAPGYTTGCIPINGGTHTFNLSKEGNFIVDSTAKKYGMQHGGYIISAIGTELNFPENTIQSGLNGPYKMYNSAGAIGHGGRATRAETLLSVPGAGVDGALLASFMNKHGKELSAEALAFAAERKRINADARKKKLANR